MHAMANTFCLARIVRTLLVEALKCRDCFKSLGNQEAERCLWVGRLLKFSEGRNDQKWLWGKALDTFLGDD